MTEPPNYGPGPQPYPQPYPQPPAPRPPRVHFAARPRVRERPQPRLSSSLAAVGAVLVLVGVVIWAGGYVADGLGFDEDTGRLTGDSRRFLGAALTAIVVAAGYTALVLRRRGPLATAGAVASAFGVPALIVFLSLDLGGGLPFNVDALYLVSIVVWVASYLVVPGAQGRGFYVALAATSFATYVALKAAGDSTVVRIGVSVAGGNMRGTGDSDTLTAVGLLFGLGYYAVAFLLDRRGMRGAAVGFAFAAFVTTASGVAAAFGSFGRVGTGVLLLVLGLVLAAYGGWAGRRFTTWVWTVGFLAGVGLLVQKALPDSYVGAGIVLIVIGAVVAAGAEVVARSNRERPDVDEAVAS